MKKNFLKRIMAAAAAAVMAVSLLPGAALAARTTSTIDPDQTGSLKLTKMTSDTTPEAIEGVGYTLYQIADITQSGNGIVYQSLMKDSSNVEIPVPDVSSNGAAESLMATIGNLSALPKFGESLTNISGEVTFSSLPVGVYLVYESTRPVGAAAGQSFIVSIPSTVTGTQAGANTEWEYDIEAVPKNTLTELTMDKNILVDKGADVNSPADDELSKSEDYQIGMDVPYQIKADVPANIADLKYFYVKDTMSIGLTYNNDAVAYGIKADGSKVALTAGVAADYDIKDVDAQNFSVYFATKALADCQYIYIEYSANLNENAAIGSTTGNINEANLYYSKTTSTGTDEPEKPSTETGLGTIDPAIDPIVYTYQVTVTKKDQAGNVLDGVEFELRNEAGETIPVSGSAGTYTVAAGGTAVITTPASGIITIKGLNDGEYQLVETKTKDGYTLLKDPIIISIKSVPGSVTYTANAAGEYYPVSGAPYYVKNGSKVFEVNLDPAIYGSADFVRITGTVYSAEACGTGDVVTTKHIRTATANTITVSSNHAVANGMITFDVINKKGFDLPQTGGMGTNIIITCGVLAIFAAVVMLISKKRKAN